MLKTKSRCRFLLRRETMFVVFLLISVGEQTSGHLLSNFTLNVNFLSYSNPTSRIGTSNRRCCSVLGCKFDCENYFTFCLRSPDIRGNVSECPLGRFETGVVSGGDNINFVQEQTADELNVRKPFTFNTLNQMIQLSVSVRSNNFLMEGVLIDLLSVNLELERDLSNVTTIAGEFGVGSITLGFQVFCAENHFGKRCSVICEGTDDVTGHYTCDSEGNVICLPGFVDPSNNCINSLSELLNSSSDHDRDPSSTSVVAMAVGGVIAASLILVVIVIIVVVTVLVVSRNRKLTNENKLCCCTRNGNLSNAEERSITFKSSTTILGDNPTYGGDTTSYLDKANSNGSSTVQPHYENTPSSSTVTLARRDGSDRSLTLTESHSYDYITSRPISGYRLKISQVQDQVKGREQLQESTSSSVTYYSIEYTQTRWTGAQGSSAEKKLSPSSGPLQSSKSSILGIPEHYETMETYNDNIIHKRQQPSEVVESREVDPRSHYEFDSES